jgi:Leucine-rich repeat (LRR) protein
VYLKYTTTGGSESPIAEIAYDPDESIYPKAVQDSMNEARKALGRAMSQAGETKREVTGFVADYNTFHVKLDDRKVSKADLARLGKLPMLMTLDLTGSEFDDDLAGLSPTSSLKSLNLSRTAINDRSLESITALRPLTSLDLSGTQISDEGIAALSDMDDLRELKLDGTQVTGRGFSRFHGYFMRLSLRGSKLDDEGVGRLGVTHVAHAIASELDLGETKLTDEGLTAVCPRVAYANNS